MRSTKFPEDSNRRVLLLLLLLLNAYFTSSGLTDRMPKASEVSSTGIMTTALLGYIRRVAHRFVVSPPDRTATTTYADDDFRMLMIGNSYTGFNNLDHMVEQVFQDASSNIQNAMVESHFPPNESFVGHVRSIQEGRGSFIFYTGNLLKRWLTEPTKEYHWNWVTLQTYSLQPGLFNSSDPATKQIFEDSLNAAQTLNNYVAEKHPQANTLFLMTYGRLEKSSKYPNLYTNYLTMQQLIQEGYQKYREATSTDDRPTFVAPIGLVFRTIYQDNVKQGISAPNADPTSLFARLYDKGDHHPSMLGSYVMALTIYATITGDNVTEKVSWVPEGIDSDTAAAVRDAVQRTIQETAASKVISYPWQ